MLEFENISECLFISDYNEERNEVTLCDDIGVEFTINLAEIEYLYKMMTEKNGEGE